MLSADNSINSDSFIDPALSIEIQKYVLDLLSNGEPINFASINHQVNVKYGRIISSTDLSKEIGDLKRKDLVEYVEPLQFQLKKPKSINPGLLSSSTFNGHKNSPLITNSKSSNPTTKLLLFKDKSGTIKNDLEDNFETAITCQKLSNDTINSNRVAEVKDEKSKEKPKNTRNRSKKKLSNPISPEKKKSNTKENVNQENIVKINSSSRRRRKNSELLIKQEILDTQRKRRATDLFSPKFKTLPSPKEAKITMAPKEELESTIINNEEGKEEVKLTIPSPNPSTLNSTISPKEKAKVKLNSTANKKQKDKMKKALLLTISPSFDESKILPDNSQIPPVTTLPSSSPPPLQDSLNNKLELKKKLIKKRENNKKQGKVEENNKKEMEENNEMKEEENKKETNENNENVKRLSILPIVEAPTPLPPRPLVHPPISDEREKESIEATRSLSSISLLQLKTATEEYLCHINEFLETIKSLENRLQHSSNRRNLFLQGLTGTICQIYKLLTYKKPRYSRNLPPNSPSDNRGNCQSPPSSSLAVGNSNLGKDFILESNDEFVERLERLLDNSMSEIRSERENLPLAYITDSISIVRDQLKDLEGIAKKTIKEISEASSPSLSSLPLSFNESSLIDEDQLNQYKSVLDGKINGLVKAGLDEASQNIMLNIFSTLNTFILLLIGRGKEQKKSVNSTTTSLSFSSSNDNTNTLSSSSSISYQRKKTTMASRGR